MKKLLIGLIVVVAVAIGVFVLLTNRDANRNQTSGNQTQNQTTAPETKSSDVKSGEVTVDINDFKFNPATLKIKKGSKVTWTNKDSVQHSIVSDDTSSKIGLASGLLNKNQSFNFTFAEVGIYTYHCGPHSFMTASLEVVE